MATPTSRHVPVIINPAAGPDRPVLKLLNHGFRAVGADWTVHLTQRAGDAAQLALELKAAGAPMIAVCGGDGTVKEVAGVLAGTRFPFAILPGGTGNALAQELGIPLDLATAAGLAGSAHHSIRSVDMGRIIKENSTHETLFVLRASMGLETQLLTSTDRTLKDQLGPLAYPLTALQTVGGVPFTRYTITLDGQTVSATGIQCTIANSAQMGFAGLTLAQGADVSDGLLDVIVLSHVDLSAVANIAASNWLRQDTGVEVQHWRGREIRVEADPPQAVALGGDVIARTPVTASVWPSALRIIAPPK
ncbi:MAG: diacylglycerol/lipid kinase family protein [Anaerolineales bacterium]